jgi:hypothetical protein
MPLSDVIVVSVSLTAPGLTAAGFGVDLILSNTGNAWATPELSRSYASLADGLIDFAATTPEGGALTALFAQSPAPTQVKIGKGTHKPTMVQTIGISSVVNSTLYKVNVYNSGVLWSASYTSDSSATTKEIVEGLVAQLTPAAWQATHAYVVGDRSTNDTGKMYEVITAGTSAGAGGPTGTSADITDGTVHWKYVVTPNFAATEDDVTITCTGSAAGNWFALEPIASGDPAAVSNLMALTEATTDPGVVTDLAAIALADTDWYGLTLLFKSAAILATATTGAAAWVEANTKLLVAAPVDTVCATAAYALAGSDPCNKIKDGNYSRTSTLYHPRAYEFADAAKEGRWLPTSPGRDNWRMKTYVGVTAVKYTGTQIANLQAKNAAFYYILGATQTGVAVDGGDGKSGSGEFIDVLRFLDWYVANVAADGANLLVQNDKIPFTDDGIAAYENILRKWNAAGVVAGGIAATPAPTVTSPVASTIPAGDRQARWLGKTTGYGVSAGFQLAGAINKAKVQVNVTQ